ncbi:MAG: prolipoprotein diacylglyceryl transferase [Clostridia bacterium]|nr:prolipoprotein diacylglyceryl transferase [Clostridia bacterium]
MFNIAFSIGGVALTWNAIMLALGILVAVVVSEILVKKRGAYKDLALDACIVGIVAGLLGARLFSAISGKISFSSFFSLSENGLNLPGALLFAGTAIAVYARVKKFPVFETFDVLLPGAFFGLAVGRWSDFFLCEGLGPVAGADGPKFFPIITFTEQYFLDGHTVAYAVFFLDFLVCAALGAAAILLTKKLKKGKASRILILLYLFSAFILEWLRDGTLRQTVSGVRFNQIVWMAMLLFFVTIYLIDIRREADAPKAVARKEAAEEQPAEDADEDPDAPDEPAADVLAEETAESPEESEEKEPKIA